MAEHPRYLDQPYIAQILQIERAQELLRLLAHEVHSPLPARWRDIVARMVVRLTALRRELEQHPERVAAERAQDEAP